MDEEREIVEEKATLAMYEQRVTKVEETVRFITIEQQRQWGVIEKISTVLDGLMKQITVNELAAVAIRERTEHHAQTIEHLQAREVDNSKILARHDNDIQQLQKDWKTFWSNFWGALKWIAVTIGALAASYLWSHFVK
jgi:chromosome segregation ATPase